MNAVHLPARAEGLLTTLSSRERAVWHEICLGKRNKEIADRLQISDQTVKNHITHLMLKVGLESRVEMATVGLLLGVASNEEIARMWTWQLRRQRWQTDDSRS
ncbi:MAG: response regulator transcription factor [Patescibacteria group bacterium]|nr:response regulator transcription factor [Patescibacteria group bacterium]